MLGLLYTLALSPIALAATYPLAESWSGKTFLDGWNADPSEYDNTTNGDVFWARIPASNTANEGSLYYNTDAGTTILKVDNTSSVNYNQKRYAPKLLSKTAYPVGTVWVMDAVHLPYGCSVWPAFWTQGPNWPNGGELDIMEGVNMQEGNQVAVHSTSACTATAMGEVTGELTETACSGGSSSGCSFKDANSDSYGAAFAAGGGGVYVAEIADEGIKVWFMNRAAVPSALKATAESVDISILGTPIASYDSSSCDIASLFGPQTMTLTITLCGDWAGNALAETCPALSGANETCYSTYVMGEPEDKFANAYFEINYINVYSSSGAISGSDVTSTANGTSGGEDSESAGSERWEAVPAGWMAAVLAGGLIGLAAVF